MKRNLRIASQGRTEDLTSGLPHESAIVSGYSDPIFVGAEEIFPTVPVNRERGSWTEYGADAAKIITGLEQPIGLGRKNVQISLSHDTYNTVKVGLNAIVYDEEVKEIEPTDEQAFRDRSITRVAKALKLYKEKAVCDYVSNSANYPSGSKTTLSTSATRWADFTNSDPIGDVETLFAALEGFHEVDKRSLRLALAPDVFNKARLHPKLAQVRADGTKIPATEESLAAVWGCEKVSVFRGKYSLQTDPKDTKTITFLPLWSNVVIAYRYISTPTQDAPLAGAIASRKGFPNVMASYRDNDKDADIYPTTDKWGMVIRAMQRMYIIDRVIS